MKTLKIILIIIWCIIVAYLLLSYKPSPWTPPDYSGEIKL